MPLDSTNWSNTQIDQTTALLITARSFVERGWCRGASARDAGGQAIDPTSIYAVAWCMWGALIAAGCRQPFGTPTLLLTEATCAGQIVPFNDAQGTSAAILAAFDRAIAASRQGPQVH